MKKKWKDDFKDPLFFSHGSTNSCEVAIGFCGLNSLHIIDKKLMKTIKFLIVKISNQNIESEQIKTLDTLKNLLEDTDNISNKKKKKKILGGDLNLVFDCNLEACGGNRVLKKKSLTKFIELKEV